MTCIVGQMECDHSLPVKNTFVHFGEGAGKRSLRVCKSEPAEPIFLRTSKHGHLLVGEGSVERCISDACLDAEGSADEASVFDDIPCTQTPEWTPRGRECAPNNVKSASVHFEHEVETPSLQIKNTFVHFNKFGTRSLRICHSEPAEPICPSKWEYLNADNDASGSCLDSDSVTDTTASLDMDLDGLSIQTPELTPRRFDSAVDSLTESLMSSPSPQWPQYIEKQQEAGALSPQSVSTSTPASPIRLDLSSDPAFNSIPVPEPLPPSASISITLRLAEKGKLGIYFGSSTGGDTLEVYAIVPGGAVHSWNRQCLFGNAANQTRYVALGDMVLSVNGKTSVPEMMQECQDELLLKMTFARMEPWACFGGYPSLEQQ